jgi:histidinol phosphatase-like enzyme
MVAKYALRPEDTWMVGDRMSDVQAGLNAGVRTALLAAEPDAAVSSQTWQCRDLPEFSARLLEVARELTAG